MVTGNDHWYTPVMTVLALLIYLALAAIVCLLAVHGVAGFIIALVGPFDLSGLVWGLVAILGSALLGFTLFLFLFVHSDGDDGG